MNDVIRQKHWSELELTELGFAAYTRRKQLVMARQVLMTEAPVVIQWPRETLYVGVDSMLCCEPLQKRLQRITDYDFWPVRIDIFQHTYYAWHEEQWQPTDSVQQLLEYGFKPYFKTGQVWAKKVTQSTVIQSIESREPILIESGMWILIGYMGEPWYVDDVTFHSRYQIN